MIAHSEVHLALRGRLLAVPGLPASNAWENVQFNPPTGEYVEEDFVPATTDLFTFKVSGRVEETGLYVIRWMGIANTGTSALRAKVDAVLAAFPPGFKFPPLANGDELRIRGDEAPSAGQIIPDGAGRAVCVITIPWIARTTVAA